MTFRQVIRLKWGWQEEEIKTQRDTWNAHAQGKGGMTKWGHSEKVAVYKPDKESSPEPGHAGSLNLSF